MEESVSSAGITEYRSGLSRVWLWSSLAWFEVKLRYTRSVIGPFWITISTGLAILTIGPIYAGLLGHSLNDFFPYLAIGIIFWGFISESIKDGCSTYVSAEGYIKDIKVSLIIFNTRDIFRNIIFLLHNITIVFVLYFFFNFKINAILFLIGFLLVVLNLFWMNIILSVICARFRDVTQIISSILQISFFITPIMWDPDSLINSSRKFGGLIVQLNPFYYLITAVRSPLISGELPLNVFTICLFMAIIGNAFTLWIFSKTFKRVPFWV